MNKRYYGGVDFGRGKIEAAFVLFDKKENTIKFISTKRWQIHILIFLCRIFSITVMIEK